MKTFDVNIKFFNPDYNKDYEKEWGHLEKQYKNPKFIAEFSYQIENFTRYRYKEDISFELMYSYRDKQKKCCLNNVCVLEILNNDKIISRFIISKSLISTTKEIYKEKEQKGYLYFYLKGDIDYLPLNPTIHITAEEIPKEIRVDIPFDIKLLQFEPTKEKLIKQSFFL